MPWIDLNNFYGAIHHSILCTLSQRHTATMPTGFQPGCTCYKLLKTKP